MANFDRISRPSGEHGFAGITGAYKAVSTGCPGKAAFLLLRWAAVVAVASCVLYVAIHFIIKHW